MISLVELLMIIGLASITAAGASHGLTLVRQSRGGRTQHPASSSQAESTGRPAPGAWHTPRRNRYHMHMRCPVEYRIEGGVANGTLLDMSKQGWRVAGEQPVGKGTMMSLRLCLPGQSTTLTIDKAIVRWTSGSEFGVELTSLSQDAAACFSDYLTTRLPTDQSRSKDALSPFVYN